MSNNGPVPFIQLEPTTGKLVICQEGIDVLTEKNQQRQPLCIIACAGLYRTGKSFLLNCIVNSLLSATTSETSASTTKTTSKSTRFPVGSTSEACTRGIWIWDPDITVRGKKIILMDSEGLASLDQDEQHDAQIFCLALLLSSFFILNTQGVIDENAIDRLYLVGEISKKICVASSSSAASSTTTTTKTTSSISNNQEKELSEYFPPFMWLLRDFHLDLEHQGRTLSTNEYLEQSLADRSTTITGKKKGRNRRTEERNDTRRSIRQLFRNRQCFTMVRPCLEEDVLRKANKLNDNELRPKFLSQLNDLVDILKQAPIKNVMGTHVDGVQLVQLASNYTDAINSGAMPEIKGAWESVVENTYKDANSNCISHYENLMKDKCTFQNLFHNDGYEGYLERPTGLFYSRIDQIHDECVQNAFKFYTEQTLGCSTTAVGARCNETNIVSIRLNMARVKRNIILKLEESSRLTVSAATERMIEYCKHDSDTLENALEIIERAVNSLKQESINCPASSSFTPLACDLMSITWAQRILPLIISTCMKQTTAHQIHLDSKERTIQLHEQEIQTLKKTTRELKNDLENTRELLLSSESMNSGQKVQLNYMNEQFTSIQKMYEEEVQKRLLLQEKYTNECNERGRIETQLLCEKNDHERTREAYYNQWLERESYIDQIEIEKTLEELIIRVDQQVTIEKYEIMRHNLLEEKKIVQEKLSNIIERISVLPRRYQENLLNYDITKDLQNIDFYELLEGSNENDDKMIANGCNDDDEPSLADGCKSQ